MTEMMTDAELMEEATEPLLQEINVSREFLRLDYDHDGIDRERLLKLEQMLDTVEGIVLLMKKVE